MAKQITRRFLDRFSNHPETVTGDVSAEFLDLIAHIHPDQDYPSEETALLCRYAYDLGCKEGRAG